MVIKPSELPKLWRLALHSFRYRNIYPTTAEALLAFRLRVHAKIRPEPTGTHPAIPIHLRQLADPVYVRPGTTDFLVVNEIFERCIYDPIRQWSLPGNATILDLGANIGLASLYFAQLLPESRLVMVEPDADSRALARQNCRRLIESRRLDCVGAFVGASDGVAGIDRTGGAWGFRKIEATPSAQTIPCLSVPTLLDRFGLDHVDLLKCDVEGSERELFADCRSWIHRVGHIVVETHAPYMLEHFYTDLRSALWEPEILTQRQRSRNGVAFVRSAGTTTQ